MKSQIVSCAMLSLALSISCAFAGKIIGNGFMPDGRECIVGTTADCTAKKQWAGKIIGNGLMPDGRECIIGTTPDCAAKPEQLAADKRIGNGLAAEVNTAAKAK